MDNQPNIALPIVVPVYNEELIIEELQRRMVAAAEQITPDYEIIFVNDGSRDASLPKLKAVCEQNPRLHYISFSRNFGHQIAITAGMDYARGEAIVTIDGDLQDPPELIPEMYAQYRDGCKDVNINRVEQCQEGQDTDDKAKACGHLERRIGKRRDAIKGQAQHLTEGVIGLSIFPFIPFEHHIGASEAQPGDLTPDIFIVLFHLLEIIEYIHLDCAGQSAQLSIETVYRIKRRSTPSGLAIRMLSTSIEKPGFSGFNIPIFRQIIRFTE